MNSFGEIRTCLVLMFSALLIIKTRARFIYHSNPMTHCLESKTPCSGHRSEDSCKQYCQRNGFVEGHCDVSCCVCYGDAVLGIQKIQHGLHPIVSISQSVSKVVTVHNTNGIKIREHPNKQNNLRSIISSGGVEKYPQKINRMETNEIDSVCLTPECVKASYSLLVNMDESINPCDDFYQFACGGFENNAVIPDFKADLTPMGGLTDKLHQQLRTMIEEPVGSDASKSSQLVKGLYASCMNTATLERKGVSPLKALLSSVGGWPVLEGDKWEMDTASEWTDLVLKLRNVGIPSGHLLSIGIGPDLKHPGKRIIIIGEPQLGLGQEQLLNPVFMAAYQKYQIDLAVLLGASEEVAVKEMSSVLYFERMLANISLPRHLLRQNPLRFYHPMTISQLQQKFPPVPWLHFIKSFLPESLDITEDEIVTVSVPQHLVNLLKLIEMTDKRTLSNYLLWRTASSLLSYMSDSARAIQLQFASKVTGQSQKPPKWAGCVALVTTTLGHATGKMYIQKYFNGNSRSEATKLFQDIHQSFETVLEEAEWMDSDTKVKAHEKAKAMKAYIGYPEELLQEDNLVQLYDKLHLSNNDFFGNILNTTKAGARYTQEKLRQRIDPDDWIAHGKPAVVNAFYSPLQNFIQFPAGILQGHFYSSDHPQFMNFGAVGWVYGHELIHGFDDQGSNFDLNGDLKDWWHPATKRRYHEKTQCIVDQYSKFSFADLVTNTTTQLNGVISQGENIADNGGIKLAYKGYQAWVKRNGNEKRLPGLNKYTSNQLFWISAANNWCSKHRPEAFINKLKMAVHPPGRFRVIGTFTNSAQFGQDFQCPEGSKMNPVKKCTVW